MNAITLTGNLTDTVDLRYTGQGKPVAHFTVAVNRRTQRNGSWQDTLEGYFPVVAFGKLGEHAADSLSKGSRVLITGRLRQDRYQDTDGAPRTAIQVVAEDVAASLLFEPRPASRPARPAPRTGTDG